MRRSQRCDRNLRWRIRFEGHGRCKLTGLRELRAHETPQNRMTAMRSTRLLISTLGLALLASGGSAFAQRYYGPAPYADRGAEEAMEHRGFQDGMFGADRDSRTIVVQT